MKLTNNFKFFYNTLKNSKYGSHYLYVSNQDIELVQFHPLTFDSNNYKNILRFKKWRQKNKRFFYSKNYITFKTTQKYFDKYFESKKQRIIFYIKYKNIFIGHFQLTNVSNNFKNLEITSILRGSKKYKGKMSDAILSISNFLILHYKFNNIFIKVKKRNTRAINFYKKNCYDLYGEKKNLLIFRFNKKKNNKYYNFKEIKKNN